MPQRRKHILFVVADGAKAQFFEENESRNGVVALEGGTLTAPEVKVPARDLKSDKPGRAFGSGGGGVRSAIEPHHDYHKLEKHKFTVLVTQTLDKICAKRKFDEIVLVAPKRSLGELRKLMSDKIRAQISHELAKDLTKCDKGELWTHLAPIAEDLHRAVA